MHYSKAVYHYARDFQMILIIGSQGGRRQAAFFCERFSEKRFQLDRFYFGENVVEDMLNNVLIAQHGGWFFEYE
jgi:hypothetical protein